MPSTEVIRTYLQLLTPDALRPSDQPVPGFRVEHADPCSAELYRFLYGQVGLRYHWTDRRAWSDADIHAHVSRAEVSVWVLYEGDSRAGFFELVRRDDGSIEIAYFGLLDDFLGRGLGKYLLTVAVRKAWEMGGNRVWLHTCTLDHPAALPNYLARGFREFKRETYVLVGRLDG